MVCDLEKTSLVFEENWKKYAQIILKYSTAAFQTKQLKLAFDGLNEDESAVAEKGNKMKRNSVL